MGRADEAANSTWFVQLAPYWSWSDYYDRECLVENSLRKSFDADQNSCAVCFFRSLEPSN